MIEQVRPRLIAVARSHGRHSSRGAALPAGRSARPLARRSRIHCRSRTRQYRAQLANRPMKLSRRAIRDSVIPMPSMARKKPARPARSGECTRRIMIRVTRRTVRTPANAGMNRQPKELTPKISMPEPMSHFPSSGWTT